MLDALTVSPHPADALLAKLSRRDRVSTVERAALTALMGPPRRHRAGSLMVQTDERPHQSTLLLSGLAGRQNLTPSGARSFTQIGLPGDFLDLHSLFMGQMDHGVLALTDCMVVNAPHDRIRQVLSEHPHLARLLWLETVVDAAIHRQWLHRMGRQDALGRLAHLICEMRARLELVGLVEDQSFALPLGQADLADCLGISTVHVNRSLMELRRRGLLSWKNGWFVLTDAAGLTALAEFDPTYLRLHRAPV